MLFALCLIPILYLFLCLKGIYLINKETYNLYSRFSVLTGSKNCPPDGYNAFHLSCIFFEFIQNSVFQIRNFQCPFFNSNPSFCHARFFETALFQVLLPGLPAVWIMPALLSLRHPDTHLCQSAVSPCIIWNHGNSYFFFYRLFIGIQCICGFSSVSLHLYRNNSG